MLYTMVIASSVWRCYREMQTTFGGRGCLRGTRMRTAVLSALLAVVSAAASQQDPAKPITETPPSQQKPETGPASSPPGMTPPPIDPARLAEPRDKAIAKAAQGLPQDDHPFILGAEDQISVTIYNSPEFSGGHMIRPDGKITIPFIGDIVAAGLAPSELGAVIKDKLKKYIVEPDVSVQRSAGR